MMSLTIDNNVLSMLGAIYAMLIIANLSTFLLKQTKPELSIEELSLRIKSWWVMVIIFTIALVFNRNVSIGFFALVSFLALKEFFSIIPTRRADRRVLFWAYLAIPLQYYWIAKEWYGMFIIFIPIYVFLFLPFRMIMIGETKNFLKAVGTIHWGLMTMVFSISHLAFLLVLPSANSFTVGGVGLVLFLVFLTQFNDVAQYIWGKMLGKHKIIPKVSPNKTWQGFIGGVVTTTLIAMAIANLLTPFRIEMAIFAGLIISISGFVGDVTISAIKRDTGIKDSGNLLPGHGGILDRIDSLTYSAPLFFHFVYYFYY